MGNLVQPIMPVESTIGLQAIMHGFEGLAANRRHAQDVQLRLQQMAQDEKLREENFNLQQQRIDNEYKVQQAQIGNYKSLENYRGQKLKEEKDALGSVGPMVKDLAAIPTDIRGTPEHENQLALIQDKYATSGVFDTARGQQVWRGANLDLLRNQRQLNYSADRLKDSYIGAFKPKGVDPGQFDYLDYDPETKDVTPNKVWGVNKDQSGKVQSVYISYDDKGNVLAPGSGKEARAATFGKSTVDQLMDMKSKLAKHNAMMSGSTVEDTTQKPDQTQAQPEAAPAQSGLSVGTQRIINGVPAQWDGTGWIAVGQ